MANVLVGRRSDGVTMIMNKADENYGGDKVALMQSALDAWLVKKGLEAGSVTVTGAAVCDISILEVQGTDLDADISIVDGAVVNANT